MEVGARSLTLTCRKRMSLRMSAAIVGAAETDAVGVLPDRSALQLHAEAAFNAVVRALTRRRRDVVP